MVHPIPGKTLTALRFAIGTCTWIAPARVGTLFGLDAESNPQAIDVGRLFAVRETGLGVGGVASEPAGRRLWWQVGVACDLFDAAAALIAWRQRRLAGSAAAMLAGTALVASALGIAALAADANID